eukprot:4826592-Alexandrium_andersonii.AAC.1
MPGGRGPLTPSPWHGPSPELRVSHADGGHLLRWATLGGPGPSVAARVCLHSCSALLSCLAR